MGIYNSSLTRVRPFFKRLISRDPSGSSWLQQLLSLAPNHEAFRGTDLLSNPGLLRPTNLDKEEKLAPPEAFLRWLIKNPQMMTWPKKTTFGPETQAWREKLMGRRDLTGRAGDDHAEIRRLDRETAIQEALKELARQGATGSSRKWWAFEGYTSVDCYLSTNRLRLYVEGKRTDILSSSTDWYPSRNQLMRNVESASSHAGDTPFGCLVIAEQRLPTIPESAIRDSFPHLAEGEQRNLMQHYLGSVTWREACEACGLNYDDLPNTVEQ